ncbi:MAG TPA: hypothetical protein VGY32_05315 [Solirubrobacteraceae bacterium]|nr:hypothetical protein [Solirubrobacteraceae bacterium]
MNAYETVTILVTAGAAAVGLVDYLRSGGAFSAAGRNGTFWFDHAADQPIDQRPSEDAVDLPIPRRPLRGRPEL